MLLLFLPVFFTVCDSPTNSDPDAGTETETGTGGKTNGGGGSSGGNNGTGNKDDNTPPVSLPAVENKLSSATGGTTETSPADLKLAAEDIDLTTTSWTTLLSVIEKADKYVALDLSECTGMTEFNPGAAGAGADKIVALTLPDTVTSIAEAPAPNASITTTGTGGQIMPSVLFSERQNGAGYSKLKRFTGRKVRTIGRNAFYGYSALIEVTLPEAATIGPYAFAYTRITGVSLPKAVTIGGNAFYGCTALTTVNLPTSLTNISVNPFIGCTRLTNITVEPNNPNYKAENGKLLSKNGATLISYPAATGQVTLDGITRIGEAAFWGGSLTSVSSSTVTYIEEDAFFKTALTSVSFPEAVTIERKAFMSCTALTTVYLPKATSVGVEGDNELIGPDGVFSDCRALTTVNLNAATSISDNAFFFCSALTTVNFPEAISIGKAAFAACIALTSVTAPKVETTDTYAFINCSSLTTVDLSAATDIGIGTFSDCTALTTVSLPSAITIDSAFSGCTALTTVSLPSAITIDSTFSGCTALTTVSLPSAITIDNAFSYCTALTTVSLPSATTIDGTAFGYCTSLETLSLPAVTSIGEMAFTETGGRSLTVTLGEAVPMLGGRLFYMMTDAKAVTVKVPASADAWNGKTGSFTGDDNTENWGNGFRGSGWDGTTTINNYWANSYITLTVTTYTP